MRVEPAARSAVALVAALCALTATTARAATLPAGSTALLSGGASLLEPFPAPAGNARISPSAVSQDGRYVAFASTSDGLVDGDDDRRSNIYVKDRVTGSVTLASRRSGAAGEPAHSDCDNAAISDDGSRVGFTCEGPLDPADTNAGDDVYVRDVASATTILISRAGGLGPVGDQPSRAPELSATGEYVAFASDATNLDPASTSGQKAYRRQIGGANATIIVSRRSAALGNEPVDAGNETSISDDGNKIAFTNPGLGDLDPADTNGVSDVYVRDVAGGTTALASRAPGAGAVGNGRSYSPALAGDGSAIAFVTESNNFDYDEDHDTAPDIYWRSLAGTPNIQNTALVSINAAGDKGSVSSAPSIDDSGWVVGFLSQATGLDPADTGASADSYVKNVLTNTLDIASRADGTAGLVANADARAVAVSGDGKKIASVVARGITPDADPWLLNVVLRDLGTTPKRTVSVSRPAGEAPFVNSGGTSRAAALSADGRFAAFWSHATGLGLPDGVATGIFVRDRVTGSVTLASRADGADGAAISGSLGSTPAISADGRRVAFTATDSTSPAEVWVRDLAQGRTFLASRADGAGGAAANAASTFPALDADGTRVSFQSGATNLGDGDADAVLDVHVRDLEADRTILVSRADGAAGAKGDKPSSGADLSADGSRVAFVSQATNLLDGDTDDQTDVHVRDLAAGTTRLVSATPDGLKANRPSGTATIDAAGTRIAFDSAATNLLDAPLAETKVFVHDLAAGTVVLASRADGIAAAPADADAYAGAISPDGGYVAFMSSAGNLGGDAPAGVRQVYRRDLAAGRTELASRGPGEAGAPSQIATWRGDISDQGGCVSFETSDGLIGPASDYPQSYLRAFRSDCAATDPGTASGGDGGAGPTGVRDTVAPTLRNVRLSRVRFRARRGTTLRFASSEAAGLSLVIERARPGRRARDSRCVRVRVLPKRRACTAYTRAGTLTRQIATGAGHVHLTGRVGRRRLAAGRYRLTVTARDAAGNTSKPVRLRFAIARG